MKNKYVILIAAGVFFLAWAIYRIHNIYDKISPQRVKDRYMKEFVKTKDQFDQISKQMNTYAMQGDTTMLKKLFKKADSLIIRAKQLNDSIEYYHKLPNK